MAEAYKEDGSPWLKEDGTQFEKESYESPSASPSATPSASPSGATPSASPILSYPVSYDRFDELPTDWSATGTPGYTADVGTEFECGEVVSTETTLPADNELWVAMCVDATSFTPGASVKIVKFINALDTEVASVRLTSAGNMEAWHGTVSDSVANPLVNVYEFIWVRCVIENGVGDGVLTVWRNTNGDWETASQILNITTGDGG